MVSKGEMLQYMHLPFSTSTPSVPNYNLVRLCSKSNLFYFDQASRKMYWLLQHQISSIEFSMKYILIVHLFELVGADTFSTNSVKVSEFWLKDKARLLSF